MNLKKAVDHFRSRFEKNADPDNAKFVQEHALEMSGLTFREATRKLPKETQQKLKKIREA